MIETPLFCGRCGVELQPGSGDFFVVRIEAFADPSPPDLSLEESSTDARRRLKELVAQLNYTSEQELMDQVYRRLTIHMCNPCYRIWIENPAGA
ncbi:MAG: hypothetical protein GXY44_15150 [Phycisphaerales bacterium]|nr:hypothetical protein [Phycisphaerales bacterium]